MNLSVSTWDSPKSSLTRPAPMWRKTSICHIRSDAWTNPWAKKRSSGVSA